MAAVTLRRDAACLHLVGVDGSAAYARRTVVRSKVGSDRYHGSILQGFGNVYSGAAVAYLVFIEVGSGFNGSLLGPCAF